jgi:hypothetical protein
MNITTTALKSAAACSFAAAMCAAAPIEIFVSPDGDDANPGTRASPVATPVGARDALRKARAANGGVLPKGGAVVEFADGTYTVSSPLSLDEHDTGAPDAPVIWRAANRAKAVFSGALKPEGWKKVDDPAILSLLPEEARGHVVTATLPGDAPIPGFRGGGCGTPGHLQEIPISLFQGERRLEPARWPNDAFVHTGENVGEAEKRHDAIFSTSGVFKFASDRLAKWAREPELWTYGLWCYEWADAKARVLAVDPAAGTLSVDPSPIGFGIKENAQFHVMNAVSEIDRPGEWAIDRANRRIYLWPDGPEPVLIAFAPGLVSVRRASNVSFQDLVFEHCRLSAVDMANSRDVSVLSSIFRRTSSWGVRANRCADCRVEGCDMHDLGEGGISLEGGDFNSLTPGNNVADNNHIHHYGRVVPNYRPGVQLNGVGNRCTHNLIHHTLHQAIAFGGNDHYIGFNVCHDCCMFNDDAGTIYCCQRDWSKRGTVIEHNAIHMTGKQPRATHTEAIYLDDYSSGVTIRRNVINRASTGIYIGGGQDCDVYCNLVLNCGTSISLGSRGIETFSRNISIKGRDSEMFKRLEKNRALFESPLWKARYPNMMRVFDFPDAQHAHDAHFNRISNNVYVTSGEISKGNWKFVSSTCTVCNNLEVGEDPGMEDYFGFRWNLKPGRARDLTGDLRMDEMGLYESPNRVSPAVKFSPDVTPPRPLRFEYGLAAVRIDLPFQGNLPEGVAEIADGCRLCDVPNWSRGKRVVASFGQAPDKWREYSFSFVPAFDATLLVETMGARGEKTLYDDFRAEGAELANGGFEEEGGWSRPHPNMKDYRAPMCNLAQPWGVLTAKEAGVPAAEGSKMACGSDMINFHQPIKVKKGVRVKITFKARALPVLD